MKSFDELKLSEPLSRAIRELGFSVPTPIQAQALPVLLGGPTDFIGQAGTGTGKTAAFGIPLLEQADPAKKHVQGLVLCPTRELALQVCGQIDLLGKHKGVRALPVYGGTGYAEQHEGLKHGVQLVVGTPGRLIEHIDRQALSLRDVKTVVLDEADEMISMGFRDDLEKILRAVPRETSRIWFFSATMGGDVRRVAQTYLRNPQQVQLNRTELLSTTVDQIYYTVRESDKPEILCKVVEAAEDFYGLVFCQTKALVADLTEYLAGRGVRVDCLHGDKSQDDRERTMRAFREKKVTLLICTDVASRGLDVKELTHVINYSVPRELDVYVHRIGRTARSGKPGTAISFMIPTHRHLISRLEHWTKTKMREGKIPTRKDIAAKKVSKLLSRFQEQKNFARAAELLGPDWKAATADMSPDEILGRFIAMTAPELFEERPKEKPFVQPHVPRPGRPHAAGAHPAKGPWKKTHNKVNRGQGRP
ncbi:MAG TPA: DEAD/DEAH box helicase [Elusimicrobiota bacterium]|nr:DEAD/DEAH box helicase [Elusimicrobiota bacterium]